MENNPKKSKAFIITFILVLLLCLVGYYFYANRAKIFDAKGVTSISKIFAPLLGNSKSGLTPVINTDTNNPNSRINGIILTDADNNKIIRAEAGENLKKGDVLYISGFNKNKDPIVMRAIANDRKKSLVFGVAGEDIKMGSMGNVIIEGILKGVPTNKNEGTPWGVFNTLYLSDKNYGGMTKNPPTAPSFIVPVGSVLKVDPIDGHIKIGGFSSGQNTNISNKDIGNLKIFNSTLLNDADASLRDYWNSVFGGGVFNSNNDSLNTNNWNNNGFELIPISIPDSNISNNYDTNFPFVTATATPGTIKIGETSVISWTSTKTTSCNSGIGNSTQVEGSFTTPKLTKDRSYVIVCTGPAGTISSTVNVNVVNDGSTTSPNITITAVPSTIKSGGTSTVSWTSERATACTVDVNNVAEGKTGSFTTPSLTKSTSYTVTCTGPGGTKSENIFIIISDGIPNAQCSDGKDNNNNGLIDIADPNCHEGGVLNGKYLPTHYSESVTPFSTATECSDGKDNNGDGKIDVADPNCHEGGVITGAYVPTHYSESVSPLSTKGECSDGIDNNNNSKIDIAEPNCHIGGIMTGAYNPDYYSESNSPLAGNAQCSDGIDNNGDSKIDIADPNCHVGGVITGTYVPTHYSESVSPLSNNPQCSDGIDNNNNGKIDAADPNCHDGGVITGTYDPSYYSESTSPLSGNAQCSDGKDNNGDSKIDIADPNCHEGGVITGVYVPTHYSESTPPFTLKTECSDGIDNNNNGKIDAADPNCHDGGVITGTYNPDYYSESISPVTDYNFPTVDITASATSVPPGTDVTISWTSKNATSCNSGAGNPTDPAGFFTKNLKISTSFTIVCKGDYGSTGSNIFVEVAPINDGLVTVSVTTDFNPITSGENAKIYWTSTNAKSCNPGIENSKSTATEGSFTTEALTSNKSYTVTCTGPSGSAGNSIFINVTTSEDKSGNPQCSDGIDNNGDGKIDDLDPNCHERGDINGLYIPTHDSEETAANPSDTIATTNSCALIDKNPLVFSEDEKSRLAVLLRKFYLISSTLRTEEDLTTLYNQIEQQKTFMKQTDLLTKQCYLQTNDELDYTDFCLRNKGLCPVGEFLTSANTAFDSTNFVRHGNPWFTKYNTGSYPYTNGDTGYFRYDLLEQNGGCKAVSGYYYGTGTTDSGMNFDCATFNNFDGYGSCTQMAGRVFYKEGQDPNNYPPLDSVLKQGCKWKEGVYFDQTERLLNIW